jgi:DNA (cytosine-5)-methyltransferase 1
MRHGSLFSGIGGFDLAAEWMGWDNVFHCEWNPFGQKILHHYWPNAIQYNDITKTDFSVHRGTIDILTGGFPCQPYSMAGKRLGKEDDRHLWPEMLRAVREIQPTWIVGENVYGLVNWNDGLVFHEVQTDLEAEGYEVQPYVLPAASVNAPHRRDRVWFVAYAANNRRTWERSGIETEKGLQKRPKSTGVMEGRFEGFCNNENAADSDRNGLIGSDCEHEEQSGERGLDAQRDVEQGVEHGDAADTTSKRREKRKQNSGRENTTENRTKMDFWSERFCQHGGAADTNTKGLEGWVKRGQSQWIEGSKVWRDITGYDKKENRDWRNFPTQSPICSGDDGLPTELDGITFSKWRNESIKGFGNAVVPQVVHQIFKAIALFESTNHEPS